MGKGSSPKKAEAKGFSGQANKICLTVAFAECYHLSGDKTATQFCSVVDSRCKHRLFLFGKDW